MVNARKGGMVWEVAAQAQKHETYAPVFSTLIGGSSPQQYRIQTLQQQVELVNQVRAGGGPNVYNARIPVESKWNLQLMNQLAESTSDREVVQMLTFGWPFNHDNRRTTITLENHRTAINFPEHMQKYLVKELKNDRLCGPFITPPWSGTVAVSPMSTRPKRGSNKRRIIVDLSWPQDGAAVNDGISKDTYLGQPMKLVYPTIDRLCRRVVKLGKKCLGYKRDMDMAFKRIPVDPFDWPLLGITWGGLIYFDKTAVMGCRSAPYACQRTTSFIRHVMENMKYFLANYVDDFMGLEEESRAWTAFETLGNLMRDIGAVEATDKAVSPSYIVEFLGVLFNLLELTISVTPDRMQELLNELAERREKRMFRSKELESLIGKLQYVSNCVRPGRVMLMRLRNGLKNSKQGWQCMSRDIQMDVKWWQRFLPLYDNVSLMWLEQEPQVGYLISTDACMTGIGGFSQGEYFHAKIPQRLQQQQQYKIHHFEMWAIIVAVKLWREKIKGKKFRVQSDNQAVVEVIRDGNARDRILQQQLRLLMFEAATGRYELVPYYIMGKRNIIPDLLSRIHLSEKIKAKFQEYKQLDWKEMEVQEEMFNLHCSW